MPVIVDVKFNDAVLELARDVDFEAVTRLMADEARARGWAGFGLIKYGSDQLLRTWAECTSTACECQQTRDMVNHNTALEWFRKAGVLAGGCRGYVAWDASNRAGRAVADTIVWTLDHERCLSGRTFEQEMWKVLEQHIKDEYVLPNGITVKMVLAQIGHIPPCPSCEPLNMDLIMSQFGFSRCDGFCHSSWIETRCRPGEMIRDHVCDRCVETMSGPYCNCVILYKEALAEWGLYPSHADLLHVKRNCIACEPH